MYHRGHVRTAKAQNRLHECAVWSGPSNFANRIIGYYGMFKWRVNTRMRLCACTGWRESAHCAHARRHLFAWRGPCDRVSPWTVCTATCPISLNLFPVWSEALLSNFGVIGCFRICPWTKKAQISLIGRPVSNVGRGVGWRGLAVGCLFRVHITWRTFPSSC